MTEAKLHPQFTSPETTSVDRTSLIRIWGASDPEGLDQNINRIAELEKTLPPEVIDLFFGGNLAADRAGRGDIDISIGLLENKGFDSYRMTASPGFFVISGVANHNWLGNDDILNLPQLFPDYVLHRSVVKGYSITSSFCSPSGGSLGLGYFTAIKIPVAQAL